MSKLFLLVSKHVCDKIVNLINDLSCLLKPVILLATTYDNYSYIMHNQNSNNCELQGVKLLCLLTPILIINNSWQFFSNLVKLKFNVICPLFRF
jgi:hypothetical protein